MDNLRIYYQNVRGLRTKLNEVYLEILNNDFDVIILTETWLNDSISDAEIFDSRYNVFRRDRNSTYNHKSDGGVY